MIKELLQNLVNKRLSSHKIAKLLNKSQTSIRYWLKKYNLNTNYLKNRTLDKKCPKCLEIKNNSEFYGDLSNNRKLSCYCKICLNKQTIDRQRKFKKDCIDYKGGKCIICQYNKYIGALEFHHLNPNKKDFNIANQRLTKFDNRIKKELDKCVLVCSNCHREIHGEIVKIEGFEPSL